MTKKSEKEARAGRGKLPEWMQEAVGKTMDELYLEEMEEEVIAEFERQREPLPEGELLVGGKMKYAIYHSRHLLGHVWWKDNRWVIDMREEASDYFGAIAEALDNPYKGKEPGTLAHFQLVMENLQDCFKQVGFGDLQVMVLKLREEG